MRYLRAFVHDDCQKSISAIQIVLLALYLRNIVVFPVVPGLQRASMNPPKIIKFRTW